MSSNLVAEPSPIVRAWLGAALQCPRGTVTEAEAGFEALGHIAERPFQLIVTAARLPDMFGLNLLAMIRAVGLSIPFLLIAPWCSERVRAAVKRLTNAEIASDWTDTTSLRAARDRLLPSWTPARFDQRVRSAENGRQEPLNRRHSRR